MKSTPVFIRPPSSHRLRRRRLPMCARLPPHGRTSRRHVARTATDSRRTGTVLLPEAIPRRSGGLLPPISRPGFPSKTKPIFGAGCPCGNVHLLRPSSTTFVVCRFCIRTWLRGVAHMCPVYHPEPGSWRSDSEWQSWRSDKRTGTCGLDLYSPGRTLL